LQLPGRNVLVPASASGNPMSWLAHLLLHYQRETGGMRESPAGPGYGDDVISGRSARIRLRPTAASAGASTTTHANEQNSQDQPQNQGAPRVAATGANQKYGRERRTQSQQ
jgi:hypothetical protein